MLNAFTKIRSNVNTWPNTARIIDPKAEMPPKWALQQSTLQFINVCAPMQN